MPAGVGGGQPDVVLGGSNQETTWGPGSDKIPPKPEVAEVGKERGVRAEITKFLRDMLSGLGSGRERRG
jgi:hypothetical protein